MNISITDDNFLERNEIFNVTVRITFSLILSRVSTGNLNQVTVTILDDDRMLTYECLNVPNVNVTVIFVAITVSFKQSAYSVYEELITVHPVLTFSNPSATDITVQVINTDVSTSGNLNIHCICVCHCK